jgi:predicted ester cyclase
MNRKTVFSRSIIAVCCLSIFCWPAISQKQSAVLEKNPCIEKGGALMSLEENKSVVRRAYELSTKKDTAALFEMYDPGYIEHMPDGDQTLEQLKHGIPVFFAAFPDLRFTIEDMVAEGDKVAYRVTVTGTHTGGPYMGLAPSGKRIEMRNTSIKRIAHGKLAESWGTLDTLSMMRQLGLVPARQATPQQNRPN